MATCPNKSLGEWKTLVASQGESLAYYLWDKYNGEVPQNEYQNKIKEGIEELFDSNPELSNIGTAEQYSAYIDSIFPDSKMKDIVYHGSKSVDRILKEGFKEGFEGTSNQGVKGFHFAFDIEDAKYFGTPDGKVLSSVVNVTNKDLIDVDEILIYSNDRVHILGSKQDIKGFKEFVKKQDKSMLQLPKEGQIGRAHV